MDILLGLRLADVESGRDPFYDRGRPPRLLEPLPDLGSDLVQSEDRVEVSHARPDG